MKDLWMITITYLEDSIYTVQEVRLIDTTEGVEETVDKLKQEDGVIDALAERVNYYN